MFLHAVILTLLLNPGGRLDPRLNGAFRESRNGWVYAHFQGNPNDIGFQYGSLLAPEIDDANKALREELKFDGKDWAFYRTTAAKMFWPRVPAEYRQELEGMAEGLRSKGLQFDATDLLVQNSWMELAWYYLPYLKDKQTNGRAKSGAQPNCSAFVATGAMTADGRPVIGHSCWSNYPIGERWNLVLDIVPNHGHHFIMDSWPVFIHSGDDFGINSEGIMVTETTIMGFKGFNENGVPEFVRAREALQYSNNLDDFERIMTVGNNGGYANTWLAADCKTNEIGELELGLKNVVFKRTADGAFVGSNSPQDPNLIKQECDSTWPAKFCVDRRTRWLQLMDQYKGHIDDEVGMRMLSDHYDIETGKDGPASDTICGHFESENRADEIAPNFVREGTGAVNGKVATAKMAEKMSFWARMGHPCGQPFSAADYLKANPNYARYYKFLKDMPTEPWTVFEAH